MKRLGSTSLLVLSVALLCAPSASADVAATMDAELRAAGVPGVTVTVATPPAATVGDVTAYKEDASAAAPSVTPENLISPDPTNPLPVATVRFGSTASTPLPALIVPLGGIIPSAEDAQSAVWRGEIMVALRHALADGASLAGVAMQPVSASQPDMWLTPPDPTYAPPVRVSATAPVSAIKTAIEEGLPAWARDATVQVSEAAGERRVALSVPLNPSVFVAQNGQDLVPYLLNQQLALNDSGAGIGGVSVELTDPATAAPLFTYSGDATFGQNFHWTSPLVAGWVGRVPSDSGEDIVSETQAQAQSVVEGATSGDPPLP